MKAIKFKGQNVVFGKNQKEYQNLPGHAQTNGIVTICMQLDKDEAKKVVEEKQIGISFLNFNRPVQPVKIWSEKPTFPIHWESSRYFTLDVNHFDEGQGTACIVFHLNDDELFKINASKVIWISIITYGSPLQPVGQSIL